MTSEAPKEIFVNWPQENGTGLAFSTPTSHRQSYTLTTHAIAMVAAERDACAELCDCRDREKPDSLYILGAIDANQAAARRIRARTPDDAQAALDALLRAERVKALREAAYLCRGANLGLTVEDIADDIDELAEKETGHE